MLKNNIPAKTDHVEHYHLATHEADLFVWAKWDNCESERLAWWCDERDFRKLAILYLWTWFVQDVVWATWWRLKERLHAINEF